MNSLAIVTFLTSERACVNSRIHTSKPETCPREHRISVCRKSHTERQGTEPREHERERERERFHVARYLDIEEERVRDGASLIQQTSACRGTCTALVAAFTRRQSIATIVNLSETRGRRRRRRRNCIRYRKFIVLYSPYARRTKAKVRKLNYCERLCPSIVVYRSCRSGRTSKTKREGCYDERNDKSDFLWNNFNYS